MIGRSVPAFPAVQRGRTALGVAMFGVLLLSYVINAMDRQIFPLLVTDIRHTYGFSLPNAGLLSTVFTLGLGVAGLPAALLLSRVSRKSVVLLGLGLFSAATVLTAFSAGFWDMLTWRILSGVGEALQLTALLTIAASYFPKHRSAAIGSVNLSFAVGAIIGPRIGGALLSSYHDWRVPLLAFGLVGFALLLLAAGIARPWMTERVWTQPPGTYHAGAATLRNRNTGVLLIQTLLGGLLIYSYLGMYPTFLRTHLGYSAVQTSLVMSIFGFGALFSLAGGWLGDVLPARLVLSGGLFVGALLAFGLFTGSRSFVFQASLSCLWGVVISGTVYVNLAAFHVKSVTRDLASRASAVFVLGLYIPAAFSGYIVGTLVTHLGWTTAGDLWLGSLGVAGGLAGLGLRISKAQGSDVTVPLLMEGEVSPRPGGAVPA